MEDVRQVIIPTRYKSKIAQYLSYPIGAEQISAALAAAPQFGELELCFCSNQFNREWRRGNYQFLRAWHYKSHGLINPSVRARSDWEINVQPVPRILRHRIHQYIVETALPQMAHWLVELSKLQQGGGASLTFMYDEKGEEFITRRFTGLAPLRHGE
jgi:hypothetical protein